ncbi:MAG: hypothetical protein ABI627_16895, partial [Polyangiaceae bacterium]
PLFVQICPAPTNNGPTCADTLQINLHGQLLARRPAAPMEPHPFPTIDVALEALKQRHPDFAFDVNFAGTFAGVWATRGDYQADDLAGTDGRRMAHIVRA